MNDSNTPIEFNQSFERCVDNPVFIEHFYEIFIASSDEVKLLFNATNMETQKMMLIKSLFYMVSAHHCQSSYLSKIADKHNIDNLNIQSHLYPLWLDALIEAAKLTDALFDQNTENLWREIMQPGIKHMKARYS